MGKGSLNPNQASGITKIPGPGTLKDSFCLLLKSMSMYLFTSCEFVYYYPNPHLNQISTIFHISEHI